MTELNPTRWLIVAGVFGTLMPWLTHWSYENLGFPDAFPMIYVSALWAGAVASIISVGGGIWQTMREQGNRARQAEAGWALGLGASGLASLLFVLVIEMM